MSEHEETRYLSDPRLAREYKTIEQARAAAGLMAVSHPTARVRTRLRADGSYTVLVKVPAQVLIIKEKV